MVNGVSSVNFLQYSDVNTKKVEKNNPQVSNVIETNKLENDSFEPSVSISNSNEGVSDPTGLRKELQDVKDKQGFVGKGWDKIKNKFTFLEKIGFNGSNKVEEIIEKAEKGEISEEEAKKAIEKYNNNQNAAKELVLGTGTAAIVGGVLLLAGPLGWAAGTIMAVGAITGAAARVGLGAAEAATNDVKGDYGKQEICEDATKGLIIGLSKGISKALSKEFDLDIDSDKIEKILEQSKEINQKEKTLVKEAFNALGGTLKFNG